MPGLAIPNRFLFHRTRRVLRDPSWYGWEFEDLSLPVGAETTHAWWLPLQDARGVCLFSHGDGGNIGDRLESIGFLRRLGLSVLAYDYGGYGRSTGRPSEQRLAEDARAAWRHLTNERAVDPHDILLFGRSLGGWPTAVLASEVSPRGVVLESAWASLRDLAVDHYPRLPPVIWRQAFDTASYMPRITSPTLILHSRADKTIPYHHADTLYHAARSPKHLVEILGDHNGGYVQSEDLLMAAWKRMFSHHDAHA